MIYLVSVLIFLCQAIKPFTQNYISFKKAEYTSYSLDTLKPQQAVIPGDFADPSVIRAGDIYYAVGTSSEWAPYIPIFKSKDLINWKQTSYAFTKKPGWAQSSFWAPELYYHNKKFYLYYVAKRKSDGVSCIGVATSADPEKGFIDAGIILGPGQEVIDPFIFNDNGTLYMSYKAYGLEKRPIELLSIRLSNNGLKTEGEPFTLLRDDKRALMEGQCIIKHNNQYYILYSVGGCCGKGCSYEVKVARSSSMQGPFEVLETPILSENENWKCPGHGTVTQTKDGRYFYLYHAYNKQDNIFTGRQGMLAEMFWDNNTGWPYFKTISGTAINNKIFEDDFSSPELSKAWQWDLKYDDPIIKLQGSNLVLSGKSDSNNKAGTVLTLRPEKGNYTINTEVENFNSSLKGVVLYGDADNAIGLGIKNNTLELWEVKKGVRTALKTNSISGTNKRWLQMKVQQGYKCRFFESDDKKNWNEIKSGTNDFYDASILPPWDRSARPGLLHLGAENLPAVFSGFKITYDE